MTTDRSRGVPRPEPSAPDGGLIFSDLPRRPFRELAARLGAKASKTAISNYATKKKTLAAGSGSHLASSQSPAPSQDLFAKEGVEDLATGGGQFPTLLPKPGWGKPSIRLPAPLAEHPTAEVTPTAPVEDHRSPWPNPILSDRPVPPFPARPACFARGRRAGKLNQAGRKVPVQSTVEPYSLEPPSSAPHLPGKNYADYYPWTSNHAEDTLSEQVIKHGFFDKASISPNEQQSARSMLWPVLKHKGGLQTLSTSIAAVLEMRQSIRRITVPSTFKPPPRVTLTDTKREAWLRDLANPSIPLRRLSRTLPHGIRGRALLDHCLNKDIPIGRAVWLARCVGANEIRATRRKGAHASFAMGGVVKWTRDWTVLVEQFVESVVALCGTDGWRAKMTYALRLAAQLFAEQLLDRDHYLDWVLGTLETASLDTLPVVLLIAQPYMGMIVQYRKLGSRLLTALLAKIHIVGGSVAFPTATSEDQDILDPISQRLSHLIDAVIILKPAVLVSKSRRSSYGVLLKRELGSSVPEVVSLLAGIERRNEILAHQAAKPSDIDSMRRRLISLLDNLGCDMRDLDGPLISMLQEYPVLLQTLLEWSTSVFRMGAHRIYAAASLVRKVKRSGVQTDTVIMEFLFGSRSGVCDRESVCRLLLELWKSGDFAVGKYLQYLIARGALNGVSRLDKNTPAYLGFLAELPPLSLEPNLANLRRNLLRRVTHSVDQEKEVLLGAKQAISSLFSESWRLDQRGSNDFHMSLWGACHSLSAMSTGLQLEVGAWMKEQVVEYVEQGSIGLNSKDGSSNQRDPMFSMAQFCMVRCIMEQMQDFSHLADIFEIVLALEDTAILSSVADCLNLHYRTFAAIGVLQHFFGLLLVRYQSLKVRKLLPAALLRALARLAARIPDSQSVAFKLQHELDKSFYRPPIAAFSPVSDHIAEVVQASDSDYTDEVERLLSSGNVIDKQTLARVFKSIVDRIEPSRADIVVDRPKFCDLLTRLRYFDVKGFDELMGMWLHQDMPLRLTEGYLPTLSSMVVSGCLSLAVVVTCSATFLESMGEDEGVPERAEAALGAMALLSGDRGSSLPQADPDQYQFQVLQQQYAQDHSVEWLCALRRALEECARLAESAKAVARLQRLFSSELVELNVSSAVVHQTENLRTNLILPFLHKPAFILDVILHLLDPILKSSLSANAAADYHERDVHLARVVHLASSISTPYCQIKLHLLFSADHCGEVGYNNVARTFFDAVEQTPSLTCDLLSDLANTLPHKVAAQINQLAQDRLLQDVPMSSSGNEMRDPALAQKHLTLVECTARYVAEPEVCQMRAKLLAKLTELLHGRRVKPTPFSDVEGRSTSDEDLPRWLTILLRLVLVYKEASEASAKANQPEEIAIAISLSLILIDEDLQRDRSLCVFLFDVIGQLVDDFSEAQRLECVEQLQRRTRDRRIRFLFSFGGHGHGYGHSSNGNGASLYIASHVHVDKPGATHTHIHTPMSSHPSKLTGAVPTMTPTTTTMTAATATSMTPFVLRHWELFSDSTPVMGENDTCLDLRLFQARKMSRGDLFGLA
ncbi:MAG: RNA polymerase II mediator complex subunit [Phylliscum demangeonii]|nr:MAG: RNA polymerase II mediator complex subunit [Phylliscum demangeonii]